MKTTVGQLLINESLPEDVRDYTRVLDKSGTKALFREVLDKHPDKYKKIAQKLSDIGKDVAYTEGSSISLDDLSTPKAKTMVIPALRAKIKRITEDDRLTQQEKDALVLQETSKLLGKIDEAVFLEAAQRGNRFAPYILSGARGNKSQLNQMIGSALLVSDHKDRPIPVPILSSFSQGLDPVEAWAASYGVRKGYSDLKMATPKAGFFSKQLANAAHRMIVRPDRPMAGTGLPVDTDDPDNEGSVLAADYGPYKAGTIITPNILKRLRTKHKRILVHSPISAPVAGGGVSQWAVGVRETGNLPSIGSNVGVAAAQAVAEPLAQSAISCLAEGTLVRMADTSVKPIEEIQVGDFVLGSDTSGRLSRVRVTRTYDQGLQPCYDFVFSQAGGRLSDSAAFETITCTKKHKVLSRKKYAGKGDTREKSGVFKIGSLSKISSILLSTSFDDADLTDDRRAPILGALLGDGRYVSEKEVGLRHVYDIEVDHPDHLFLLANGMIVSNSKHVAGVAGASGKGSSAESRKGFEVINQLANIPKHVEGRAPVAQLDGYVSKIEDAPQGGQYIYVGDKAHYVSPGQQLQVKSGQRVEAGDVLTDALPNPAEVVRYKGIGEGRRYFANTMRQVLRASGVRAHRRNIELLSRALINHIRVSGDDLPDGMLPDDIVEYDDFAARYTPRKAARVEKTKLAKNKYLEQPTLHYSVGTRVTPSVMKELQEHKVNEVLVHDEEPGFVPEMQRAMDVMSRDPDWMVRMGGFYLQKNLLESVHRGSESKMRGSTSFIPSLARGIEFGRSDKGPY